MQKFSDNDNKNNKKYLQNILEKMNIPYNVPKQILIKNIISNINV